MLMSSKGTEQQQTKWLSEEGEEEEGRELAPPLVWVIAQEMVLLINSELVELGSPWFPLLPCPKMTNSLYLRLF